MLESVSNQSLEQVGDGMPGVVLGRPGMDVHDQVSPCPASIATAAAAPDFVAGSPLSVRLPAAADGRGSLAMATIVAFLRRSVGICGSRVAIRLATSGLRACRRMA